jgi:hypothetical protein
MSKDLSKDFNSLQSNFFESSEEHPYKCIIETNLFIIEEHKRPPRIQDLQTKSRMTFLGESSGNKQHFLRGFLRQMRNLNQHELF